MFADSVPRIVVLGTTGSGKTTVARALAQGLTIPHVELDAFRFDPNWTEVPNDIFRERISQALKADAWVVDGNYSIARDLIWPRANTVVWLDYPLRVIMRRLLWRTLRRSVSKEELWNGNRERFRTQFLSRDSLILWALKTYRRLRRQFPLLFEKPEHTHLRVVHLSSPRATKRWLSSLIQLRPVD